MAEVSSRPALVPAASAYAIWARALMIVAFMLLMLLPTEAIFAVSIGAYLHLPLLGTVLMVLFVLPTLVWLLGPGLRRAVDAERYIASER